jgi:hypothetical protein
MYGGILEGSRAEWRLKEDGTVADLPNMKTPAVKTT